MMNTFSKCLLQVLMLCVICCNTVLAQTQDLVITILDDTTSEPVELAFVFFENTTIGGSTDESGQIYFANESIDEHTIVITHLFYEEVQIQGTDLTDQSIVVRLKPKSYDLDEVIVKTKKGRSKNYRKWKKRFEEAFIGKRKIRRKVKILNPEVIWFDEKGGVLHAYAMDNIKLRNELTGYVMHIALKEFSLSDEGDITYSGSVFFDDIMDELKKPQSIEKRRKEYFKDSRQLFFKSLFWKHPLIKEDYYVGITREEEGQGLVYKESNIEQLRWNRGVRSDTLEVDGYLTVVLQDKVAQAWKRRGVKYSTLTAHERGTSFLLSKIGKFVVDKKGYLLNQSDIEESGYWTSVRMAHELPSDYIGNVYFHEEESIAILQKLQSYPIKHQPEKIYVHTDKSTYLPFEHLWFKAYLVNAVDHSIDTPSEVVYVDLVNEEGEIVKKWLLNSGVGLAGDMQWTPTYETGTYLLRAYTNHMRNQGEQFFFEKELMLTSLGNSTQARLNSNELSDVKFYPEGGDLIEGVSSQIAFVSVDTSGLPVDIVCVIKDNNDVEITRCQSIHHGVGLFQLNPDPSKTYYLETDVDGEKIRFDLPNAQTSGINMRINVTGPDNIYIDILSSRSEISEDAFLIGHMRGEIFAFVDKLSPEKPLTIAKSSIPPGVVHFTLFDQHERPQSERLVFNDLGYEKNAVTSNEVNLANESHSMTFTIDSLYLDNPIDLSMSIVDEVHYPTALEEQNIASYLHLNSDLETHIEGLNSYLVDIDMTKRYYLDLILRTQAWRRFTWKDLQENKELVHKIETGYSINGEVTEKDGNEPLQSRVMITALGPDLYYDQINSDGNGKYSFDNLSAKDSITYIIQARKGKFVEGEKESIDMEGDRLVDISASAKLGIPFAEGRSSISKVEKVNEYGEENIDQLTETYVALQSIDSSLWQIEADEITIQGKRGNHTSNRPYRGTVLYLDYADWIAPSASGVSLINSVAPSKRFHFGAGGKLYSTIVNYYGETITFPAQVIIDGFGAEPGTGSTSTPHQLRTLPADMIETIFVGEGVVSITTRSIPRSVEKRIGSGIIHLNHPGYYEAREFSEITRDLPPKLVSTVLWNPDVQFDEQGNLEVTIKDGFQKSGYMVVLEGVSVRGDVISFRKKYGE